MPGFPFSFRASGARSAPGRRRTLRGLRVPRRPSADRARHARVCFALIASLGLAARTAAAEPPPAPGPEKTPITVELGAHGGFAYRIGDGPSLPVAGRAGGVFGLTAAVSPWSRATVGLGWEHTTVGSERGQGELADVEVRRSLDVFWASMKLFIVHRDRFGFFLEIGPGLALQHADADVLVYPVPGTQVTTYRCSESGGPGFALRAGLGVDAQIVGGLWFTARAVLDHVQASSAVLGDCVPGAGSLPLVGGQIGLSYRHDVSRWVR